jgi:hypothetical protein
MSTILNNPNIIIFKNFFDECHTNASPFPISSAKYLFLLIIRNSNPIILVYKVP